MTWTNSISASGAVFSRWLTSLLLALPFLGVCVTARASESFPARPITIIVGSPAGGLSDVLARFIGERLGQALKQTVIVDNKPGAGGSIAASAVAKATADGYTLMLVPDSVMVVNQFIYAKLPYIAERDFQSLALVGRSDVLVVTHPRSGLLTFSDFVRQAKAQPKALAYASAGNGHPTHLMMELTASRLGFEVSHVPYKGTSPAIQDVAAGQLQVMFVGLAEARPLLAAGRLVALAATGPGARQAFPNLPLLKDLHPDLDLTAWFGMFGPSGLPRDVATTLTTEINRILQTPEARERFAEFGVHPSPVPIPALEAVLKADRAKAGPLVKALGIKLD